MHKKPDHIAIIMDGNARWAKSQDKNTLSGHVAGAKTALNVIEWAIDLDVSHLSLYVFSLENLTRPKDEIENIFDLFLQTLRENRKKMLKNGIRLHFVGFFENIDNKLHKEIEAMTIESKSNTKLNLYLLFNYGGQQEIVHAYKKALQSNKDKVTSYQDSYYDILQQNMLAPTMPQIDLLIRTGGRRRVSNILLWYIAYAEIYFIDILWPDFSKSELLKALEFYADQTRSFGSRPETV